MNQITGELSVWKETQYFDVREESHDNSGVASDDAATRGD